MSLEITYYGNGSNKNMYGRPLISETRTASGTSAQSAATPANAEIIRIVSTAANRYAYSSASSVATATAGKDGHYLASGATIDIEAVPGWKLAVITAS